MNNKTIILSFSVLLVTLALIAPFLIEKDKRKLSTYEKWCLDNSGYFHPGSLFDPASCELSTTIPVNRRIN